LNLRIEASGLHIELDAEEIGPSVVHFNGLVLPEVLVSPSLNRLSGDGVDLGDSQDGLHKAVVEEVDADPLLSVSDDSHILPAVLVEGLIIVRSLLARHEGREKFFETGELPEGQSLGPGFPANVLREIEGRFAGENRPARRLIRLRFLDRARRNRDSAKEKDGKGHSRMDGHVATHAH
jgi:hypothetical protein